jgi:hypothetical protein
VQRLAAWSWPIGEPATGNIRARDADSHLVARWLVAISGAMLAISAAFVLVELRFMHPAVVVPIGVGPCLCGAALAMLPRGTTGLRIGAGLLRGLAVAIAGSGLVVMFVMPSLGIIELLAGLLGLAGVGMQPMTAHRAALVASVLGAIGVIWFALVAGNVVSPAAPVAALGASIGLVAGGAMWLAEPSDASLPRATARVGRTAR